ncbi:MAG: CHAT domain-containing protein [Kineosporiaceae bacterium]
MVPTPANAVSGHDRLRRAELAYEGAVGDPGSYTTLTLDLVEECRRAGDHEAHVVALRALGWIEHLLVGNHAARERLDLAVRLAQRHDLTRRLPELLTSRAAVNHELGRMTAAHHDLDRALHWATRHGGEIDGVVWCQIALQRAVLCHNQGDLAEAGRLYRELLARRSCPPAVQVKAGNNLAHLLAMCGRPAEALPFADAALAGAGQVGPGLAAAVAQTRAWVLMQTGRLPESMHAFEDAERRFRAASLPTADFSIEYADALVELRLMREAANMTQRAVTDLERLGAPLIVAEARLRRARLSMADGDPAQALTQIDDALAALRRQRRPSWVAGALVTRAELVLALDTAAATDLTSIRRAAATLERLQMSAAVEAHLVAGRLAVRLDRPSVARDSWQRAHQLSRGRPVLVRLRGRLAAASAADLTGRPGEVVRQARLGLADLARHRAALPSMELRALASGHGEQLGVLGLRALVPSAPAAQVLSWLERTRAAAMVLVDPPPPPEIQQDLATLRSLESELREARRADAGESGQLLARVRMLERRIRRAAWSSLSPAAGEQRLPDAASLRAGLDGAVLVEFAVLDGEVLAVVMDSRRTRLVRLGPYAKIAAEREALRFSMRRLSRGGTAARSALGSAGLVLDRLRQLLLAPLMLAPDVPLVIVPARGLHGVPWSALQQAPVSVAPSAATWLRTRTSQALEAPAPGPDVVLVAGPDLPGALAEVSVLEAAYAPARATVMLPPASTVRAVTSALSSARVAHLACHGFLRTDNPTFSSFQLSDGSLTVHELAAASRLVHRVVLAACRSGAQVSYAGEEVLGFVSAFMARGTAGMVAATTPVPDGESVPLMSALHHRIARGDTLSQALWSARASIGAGAEDFVDRPVDFMAWFAYTAYGAA